MTSRERAEPAVATAAVDVSGLGKRFGRGSGLSRLASRSKRTPVQALDGVSFEVGPGELVAVVGANGSGKSTLLRILATVLLPSEGSARVGGFDAVACELEVRRRVALVAGDDRSFNLRLSGRDNLAFFAALHGRRPEGPAVEDALARVGLAPVAGDTYATYSSGMRQRLALARGLLACAAVLLLDEPFRALDEQSSRLVVDLIGAHVAGGGAALVATHHLEEMEGAWHRVLHLDAGRLVDDQVVGRR
ncbi:MAG: heme ABC exporter ATP-binding protein CcmA [Actinomycetota bacterium]